MGKKLDFFALLQMMRSVAQSNGHANVTDDQLREGLRRYADDLRLGVMTAEEFLGRVAQLQA